MRDVRPRGSLVARAVGVGAGLGAVLGLVALVPDLVTSATNDPRVGDAVTAGALPIAAGVGAGIGAWSALVASLAWVLFLRSAPEQPGRARLVAGLGAGAAVLLVSLMVWGNVNRIGVAGAVVACCIAAAAVPLLAYRYARRIE